MNKSILVSDDELHALESRLLALESPNSHPHVSTCPTPESLVIIRGLRDKASAPSPDYASRVRDYLALRAKASGMVWTVTAIEQMILSSIRGNGGMGVLTDAVKNDAAFIAASHTAADLLEEGLRIMEGKA